jgi:AcrR family transcriptional regulator
VTELSGRGDPARTMALLWRTHEPPARGPKPGLNVDRIVRAAIEIADAEGLAALSMRRVADRLGVGTMSLYTYVPGKAELIDLMLDMIYGETARPPRVDGGWRGALEQVARENWALCHRHPWMLYVSIGRPLAGPHETAKYDHELRAVDGVGLSDVEMDAALRLVLGHVHAAARSSIEKAGVEHASGMTDAQWWRKHAPLLEKVVDAGRYPIAARVGEAVGVEFDAAFSPEYAFEFGLQRILDGIEALIQTR